MFTVVIPTLWLTTDIIDTCQLLETVDLVEQVIVVNNNPHNELIDPAKFTKIKFINPGQNLYITASWNRGVAQAKSDLICLLNDDCVPNEQMFRFVSETINDDIAIIGGNNQCFKNPTHKDELLSVQDLPLGFGSFMFFERRKYRPIPESIKLWYNDNWLFENIKGIKYTYIGAKASGGTSKTIQHESFKSHADLIIEQDRRAWSKMKNLLKICVYAIAKNEEHFVQRFYDSAKDADLIVLADTGSTDNTVKTAKKLGIKTYDIHVSPWRFDTARNTALNLVPKNIDVCVSLDLDEQLQPGWREEIERVWIKNKTNQLRYRYDWGQGLEFYYEKIHARTGFDWRNICHETLYADPRTQVVWANTDQLLVKHLPDPSKSRGQYMDLLEADITLNPHSARHQFYYARELYFNSRYAEAADACEKFLAMKDATWNHERAYARRIQGKSYSSLGMVAEALTAFRKGVFECEKAREPWVDLADFCQKNSLWRECYFAATTALNITDRQLVYTADPECWGSKPYDLAALGAHYLGIQEQAVYYGQQALAKNPQDKRLENNLIYYRGERK